jgi:dTDP-4-dehydrorhamnose reductase
MEAALPPDGAFMPNVLVLGAAGMLGNACLRRLRRQEPEWQVDGIGRATNAAEKFDVTRDSDVLERVLDAGLYPYHYVINCIGVLKADIDEGDPASVTRAVVVNALFPHLLALQAGPRKARVLSVSTDAVFSGRTRTPRVEESPVDPVGVYGRSKALGESNARHVLNIRCSIVGRDARGRGLTEWYLRTPATATVSGFSDYIWTPATVYQVADFIHGIVKEERFEALRQAGEVVHFAPNPALSKFDYLTFLNRVSGQGPRVQATLTPDGPRHRVLTTSRALVRDLMPATGWAKALRELLSEDNRVERV